MQKLYKTPILPLSLLLATHSTISLAYSKIDEQREQIVIASRENNTALTQAIQELRRLYKQTSDKKVRDDLIALLIRQENYQQALNVCAKCKISDFSESELENLARAARNQKQLQKSLALYQQLAKKFPQNPNGLLGSGLLFIELARYQQAKDSLNRYITRFGQDSAVEEALGYLRQNAETEIGRIGRLQDELQKNPQNQALALELYRLAAKYNLIPLQQRLKSQYPELFSENDAAWLSHTTAINNVRGEAITPQQLDQSFQQLSQLIAQNTVDSPIYRQALQDRIVLAVRLKNYRSALADYRQLEKSVQTIPNYVQESYADALLAEGSPSKALSIYQNLVKPSENIPAELRFKLVNAASDSGQFKLAEQYANAIDEPPFVQDYTHTQRIINPNYDRQFFSQVSLTNWRGNKAKAMRLLEERLQQKTPGDPWTMLEIGELSRAFQHYDDAETWANNAMPFLAPHERHNSQRLLANVALDRQDWKTASQIIRSFDDTQKFQERSLLERYERLSSTEVIAHFGIQHKTSPKDSENNEVSQEYLIYSPRSFKGHRAYVHYLANNAPNGQQNLKQQRAGAGVTLNFYPLDLNFEAGRGIKLNDRAYFTLNLNYQYSQHWSFALQANRNGSQTPIKAIQQNIYSKDIGIASTYRYSDRFQAGLNANWMKFDDSNLRQNYFVWANLHTLQKDRWSLSNSLRFDYQKNRQINNAIYYNPEQSKSVEFGTNIAYLQPFDYGLILTHHLKGNIGRYSQKHESHAKTWSLSYEHQWRVGKKLAISYEIGRKKNIYDGDTEFNNFANVNFSFYFK